MLLTNLQRASLEKATKKYEESVDEVAGYLTSRGITKETAIHARLGFVREAVRGDDEYVGRLSIPYITTGGVVDIRYRSVDGGDPKYLSRGGSKVHLYGVRAFTWPSRTMVVTEGELDCLSLQQCGVAAVGFPGANAWKDHWQYLFSDYETVLVVCDGDQAGRDFGRKLTERIEGVTVVHLPEGQDSNSVLVEHGRDHLLGLIGVTA